MTEREKELLIALVASMPSIPCGYEAPRVESDSHGAWVETDVPGHPGLCDSWTAEDALAIGAVWLRAGLEALRRLP
jgi:hypothetical protein